MQAKDIIIEVGGEPIYYFAYGMLTDPQMMPGAQFIGPAVLQNYAYEFARFANVYERGGSNVDGVLWELPTDYIRELDAVEGYPRFYGRKTVPVISGGKRYVAWVYYMTPAARESLDGDLPSMNYVRSILNGFRHAGITPQQVSDAYYDLMDEHQPRSGK
ncbi:gamma-glutamylcyclotransferase [bacterium]|nr:gamma-glutamylcyclotransferase [bacterium]